MHSLLARSAAWIAVAAALSACSSTSGGTRSPAPEAPPSSAPVLNPTPVFDGRVHGLTLRPDSRPGDWQVLGLLENGSGFAVADIQLSVFLEDPRGEKLAETTVLPVLPHLGPGEVTPFEARFQGVGAVTGADARVLLARRTPIQRADPLISQPEVFVGEDGSTLLLGLISNPGSLPIAIDGLAYLGMDSRSEARALAPALHAPGWLEAGASSPFLASVAGTQEGLRWVAFVDAQEQVEVLQPGISLSGPPTLQLTAQGLPFAVGTLMNSSDQARRAALLLVVRHEDRVLSVSTLASPFPIGPGEQLPFGQADFPGLSLRVAELGLDPAALTLEAQVDPRASEPFPDHRNQLEVQIDSFETVGSAVFLRGAVTNPYSVSLSRPSLYAALGTTEGELLTAGWRELAARLAGGERLEFVVDLPFPAAGDLSMAEFDVVAYGLGP